MNLPTPREVFGGKHKHELNATDILHKAETIEKPGIYSLPVSQQTLEEAALDFDTENLPDGIGFRGGAARNVLRALVTGYCNRPPRDADVVAYGDPSNDSLLQVANTFAKELSPRDYEYGHGAELISSVADFMSSQDFTVNQILLLKQAEEFRLITTAQAIQDTVANIVRPTIFELNAKDEYYLSNKLVLKSLRLLSVLQADGFMDASIKGINFNNDLYGDPRDDSFMQALQLDKALGQGIEVVNRYIDNLRRFNMAPYDIDFRNIVTAFEELCKQTDFEPSSEALKTIKLLHSLGSRSVLVWSTETPTSK